MHKTMQFQRGRRNEWKGSPTQAQETSSHPNNAETSQHMIEGSRTHMKLHSSGHFITFESDVQRVSRSCHGRNACPDNWSNCEKPAELGNQAGSHGWSGYSVSMAEIRNGTASCQQCLRAHIAMASGTFQVTTCVVGQSASIGGWEGSFRGQGHTLRHKCSATRPIGRNLLTSPMKYSQTGGVLHMIMSSVRCMLWVLLCPTTEIWTSPRFHMFSLMCKG